MSLQWTRHVAIAACAALLSACALSPLLTGEANFAYAELAERADKRFPLQREVAGLLTIKLTRPRIEPVRTDDGALAPERRVRVSVDAEVKLPLTQKAMNGTLAISGTPVYRADTKGIHLRDAKMERVRVDNVPDALSAGLAKAATQFAKENFEDKPLYVFKPEDLKRWGLTIEPTRIEVRDKGLALFLK